MQTPNKFSKYFRLWHKEERVMLYGDFCFSNGRAYSIQRCPISGSLEFECIIVDSWDQDAVEVMQDIVQLDGHGNHVYVNDILQIRVWRGYHDRYSQTRNKNKNFSSEKLIYYVYCFVKDVKGNLEYNKEQIKKLELPMGKEQYSQSVHFDWNIFDPHACEYRKIKSNGDFIRYSKEEDINRNIKYFYDYVVIGNTYENSGLMMCDNIIKMDNN